MTMPNDFDDLPDFNTPNVDAPPELAKLPKWVAIYITESYERQGGIDDRD